MPPDSADAAEGEAADAAFADAPAADRDAPLAPDAPSDAADPATCPVGVADGCCPQAIVYGGHDPDCPLLSCTNLGGSPAAIPLENDWQTTTQNGIGMAWTGRELVLAWSDVRSGAQPGTSVATIRYQRRDETGAVSFGPVTNDDGETTTGGHSQSELGFDPAAHALFFTGDILYARYGELLDASGAPASTPVTLGAVCNPITSRNQIFPTTSGFLVAQGEESCGAAQAHDPRVDAVGFDGKLAHTWTGDTAYDFGMAWDPNDQRILFSSANNGMKGRWFAPPASPQTPAFTTPVVLESSDAWDSAGAFDGTNVGIAWGRYFFNGTTTAMTPTFDLWSFPGGAPPALQKSTPLLSDQNLLEVPPRVVWTGAGWLVFSSVWPGKNSQGLPDQWTSFVTWVSSLAPDGTIRETFQLDTHPAYLVNAIWAGGRVAVTWVAADGQGHERHYLRYLACT